MWLNDQDFAKVIAAVPLVSIDFVIINERNQVLLGKRLNRPAKGFWFVPGGRVRKNENLDSAFARLFRGELGIDKYRVDAEFIGVYEHFYGDTVFGNNEYSSETHYVVIAYKLYVASSSFISLPVDQHERFTWWDLSDFSDNDVHEYTKKYFFDINKDLKQE